MVAESLADEGQMASFAHIVSEFLPRATSPRTTLGQVRAYVSGLLDNLGQQKIKHAPSKDIQRRLDSRHSSYRGRG